MIAPGTQLHIVVVRLSQIIISENQARYPERVMHYVRLLTDPAHAEHYAGVAHLAPYGVNTRTHEPLYTLLDGHHRYLASVIAGRETLLGIVHVAPEATIREAPRETRQLAEAGSFDDYETLALLPAVSAGR